MTAQGRDSTADDTRTLDMPGGSSEDKPPVGPPAVSECEATLAFATAVPSANPGHSLGEYELLEKIGSGGMGAVFKARHLKLQRVVALKVILGGPSADPESLRRFRTEVTAAATLDHPGIVPIFDVGEFRGVHYYSMALVEGPTLAQRLSSGPLDVVTAAELVSQIASAVAFAHSKGVVHRDLKPANILLSVKEVDGSAAATAMRTAGSFQDAAFVPRIADFGLAKLLDGTSEVTHTGQIVGTPHYMSPEQAAGASCDVREPTDIYALGAILYATLTGRPPFESSNPFDVLVQVLESEPLLPRKLRPSIPYELECICLKCLEKHPGDRYASAAELADDLRRFLQEEPIRAQPANLLHRIIRWARREPSLAAHLAGILAVLAIANLRYFTGVSSQFLGYHLTICGLLVAWGASSVACQRFAYWDRFTQASRFLWSGLDVAFTTLLLYLIVPPRGPFLVTYPLLIVASGIFFRIRLVVFTTVAAMLAYGVLQAFSLDEPIPFHYAVLCETILAIVGLITAHHMHRVGILSRHLPKSTRA